MHLWSFHAQPSDSKMRKIWEPCALGFVLHVAFFLFPVPSPSSRVVVDRATYTSGDQPLRRLNLQSTQGRESYNEQYHTFFLPIAKGHKSAYGILKILGNIIRLVLVRVCDVFFNHRMIPDGGWRCKGHKNRQPPLLLYCTGECGEC